MPIFYYAFHSKPHATDKLHILVQVYHRDPEGPVDQREDPARFDYGVEVESECGLKGISIRNTKDVYDSRDYEGMGLKQFRQKFSDIDKVYFFMIPLLRASMPIAIAEDMISEDKICQKCKDNLNANVKRAMETRPRRDAEEVTKTTAKKQEDGGVDEGDEEEKLLRNNMLLSNEATRCLYCGSSIKWVFYKNRGAWRSMDLITEKEHECDFSNTIVTADMDSCEHCGKMIRWEPAPESEEGRRPMEIYFYPEIQHQCHSKSMV
jgi:hypothetical protein